MSKRIFSAFEQKQLESNPNVDHISDRSIRYASDFKLKAVEENKAGKGPKAIFLDHGFDLEMIGSSKPNECLKRWRSIYNSYGKEGFYTERRGKGSVGRPSSKALSAEEKLQKAEARIAFLEMENDFFKKARRTRKAGEEEALTLSERCQLIEQTIRQHQLKRMVTFLCRIASVNRSSYYAWLASEDHRTHREQQDEEDYKLLKTLYKQGKKREGGRQLKIKLENDYGVIMNLKKIFRLTRKFHIQASFVKRILIEN